MKCGWPRILIGFHLGKGGVNASTKFLHMRFAMTKNDCKTPSALWIFHCRLTLAGGLMSFLQFSSSFNSSRE